VPDIQGKVLGAGDWKTDDDFDSQHLLEEVAWYNESKRTGEIFDSAFSDAQWSPDSLWVSIEGGSHKFWHMQVYHLDQNLIRQVDLSQLSKLVSDYYNANPNLHIQSMGIDAKIKAIRHRNYDWAYVGWMGNGLFAVNGYPFFLNDPHFEQMREHGELYFLIDCRDPKNLHVTGVSR
jgi:hypothetical protein